MQQQRGTVKAVRADLGFGFISRPGWKDVFFHRSAVRDGTGLFFSENLIGTEVEFDVLPNDRGDRAENVRVPY